VLYFCSQFIISFRLSFVYSLFFFFYTHFIHSILFGFALNAAKYFDITHKSLNYMFCSHTQRKIAHFVCILVTKCVFILFFVFLNVFFFCFFESYLSLVIIDVFYIEIIVNDILKVSERME